MPEVGLSTYEMLEALEEIKPAQQFLLNTFFTRSRTFTSRYVVFDVYQGKRKMAPFVSPLHLSHVGQREDTKTEIVEPPYLKEKLPIQPQDLMERFPGEDPFNPASLESKKNELIMRYLADIRDQFERRKEWMAAQQLFKGSFTATGDGVSINITLPMLATHKMVNTDLTANGWDQTGSDKMADLAEAKTMIAKDAGLNATEVIFSTTAWTLFKNDTKISDQLNKLHMIPGMVRPFAPGVGATYQGTMEGFNFWTYDEWYLDDAGTEQPMVPSDYVAVASPALRATQLYGAIQDMEALRAVEFYPDEWQDKDPSTTWVRGQSAPLPIIQQVNGFVSMKVKA